MGVILLGDKTAAARWLAYAKSRAAALAKQGNNLSQTFSPAEGVTIRVQTLQGVPRVWIEAGGMDYIASDYDPDNLLDVVTDSSLYGGRLRGGAAKPVGKSSFGQFTGHNLYPLGDGEFLGGPPQQSFSGAVQLVTTTSKTAKGQAFSPWQDPAYQITGVHDVLYSGLVDSGQTDANGNPIYKKRFHVVYLYQRDVVSSANPAITYSDVACVAVATTIDGGETFSTTIFDIRIETLNTVTHIGFMATHNIARVTPRSAVFCGDNKIAILCQTVPYDQSGYVDLEIAYGGALPPDSGAETWSILALTSGDGGATWALSQTYTQPSWGNAVTAAYVGDSTVLAVSTYLFAGNGTQINRVWKSTDNGATFSKLDDPGTPEIRFSDLVCLGLNSAAYYSSGAFYRTHDAGLTWEALPVPPEFDFEPGRIALRNTPTLPDTPPVPPKPVADYAQIAMLTVNATSDQVALSDDGGNTWIKGGTIPKRVPNVGIINRKLPAFPVFPDLHKNGLPIP